MLTHPGPLPGIDTPLVPYYEQIRQYGLEAQFTTESWLYKVEAIRRSGARNLLGQEEDYNACILGLERTLYALFDSVADMTILGEWFYDERGSRATSVWQNDLFIAGFLAFNDVQGTELVAGILTDLRHETSTLNMELKPPAVGQLVDAPGSVRERTLEPEGFDLRWTARQLRRR